MKKLLSIILMASMALCLFAGCGKSEAVNETEAAETTETTVTTTAETTEAEPQSIDIGELFEEYNSNGYSATEKYVGPEFYFYLKVSEITDSYASGALSGNKEFEGTYYSNLGVMFSDKSDLGKLAVGSTYRITATIDRIDKNDITTKGNIVIRIYDAHDPVIAE